MTCTRSTDGLRAYPLLLVAGSDPTPQFLKELFWAHPIGVTGVTCFKKGGVERRPQALKELWVEKGSSCADGSVETFNPSTPARHTLHEIAVMERRAHSCTSLIIESKGGSRHLIESLSIYM